MSVGTEEGRPGLARGKRPGQKNYRLADPSPLAVAFRGLATLNAVAIVSEISRGATDVAMLAARTGLPPEVLTYVLRKLVGVGLIETERTWTNRGCDPQRVAIRPDGFQALGDYIASLGVSSRPEPLDSATVVPPEGRGRRA